MGSWGYTVESYLDVNLDGTDDLLFQAVSGGGMGGWGSDCRIFPLSPYITITGEPDTTLFISPVSPYDTTFVVVTAASALPAGTPIGPADSFLQDTCYIWSDFWIGGIGPNNNPRVSLCDNRGDRYVGFQLKQTTDTIYGWIRGEVVRTNRIGSSSYPHWTLFLKDFAIDKLVNLAPSITAPNRIILFPNPAETNVQLDLSAVEQSGRQVRIYKYSGKLIVAYTIPPGQDNLRLDISGWTNGLYFVEVSSLNGRSTSRFIVQH